MLLHRIDTSERQLVPCLSHSDKSLNNIISLEPVEPDDVPLASVCVLKPHLKTPVGLKSQVNDVITARIKASTCCGVMDQIASSKTDRGQATRWPAM